MLEAIVSVLGVAMLAVIGWAFQLNSEVNVQRQRHEDLLKLIDSRFASLAENVGDKFDSTSQRLERIERALNGAIHRA